MSAITVSEITIFAAAALALISFVLPWVEVAVPMVAKITRNGFSTYAFWFGLVFVYPVWMALTKQSIERTAGFVCAGIGIIAGIAYPHFVIARGLGSIEKGLDILGGPAEMTQAVQEITRELTAVGSGAYLFIGACILLIVGIILRHRAQLDQDITQNVSVTGSVNQSKLWMAVASLALGCVALGSTLVFGWRIGSSIIEHRGDIYYHHLHLGSLLWLISLLVCVAAVYVGHRGLKTGSKPILPALYFSGIIYFMLLSFILYVLYHNVRFNTLLYSSLLESQEVSMFDFFRSKHVLAADISSDSNRYEQYGHNYFYGGSRYYNGSRIVRDKNENRYIFIYEDKEHLRESGKSAILYCTGLFPTLFVLWHVVFILGVFWGHKGLKTNKKTAKIGLSLHCWGFLIYMLFPILFGLIGLNITQAQWWWLFFPS